MLDYFPDYKINEEKRQKVTLKNLLTMTALYKYKSEPYACRKIVALPLWFFCGRCGMTGEFQYSALGIHIFTGIIVVVNKMTTVDFANKYLFKPIKIAPRKISVALNSETYKVFTIGKIPKGNNLVFRR